MTSFLIIGDGTISMRLKMLLALHNVQIEIMSLPDSEPKINERNDKALDIITPRDETKIYEGVRLELEPEFTFQKICCIDNESRITIDDLKKHTEVYKRAINKEILEMRIVPKKIPIPAQCQRAAKIQRVWKTQQ